jgi:hypothetical protein
LEGEELALRAFKYIITIVIVLALGAGAVIFALKHESKGSETSDQAVTGSVQINEIMASNSSFLPDDQGSYSDWIEIYNPGESPVSLSGLVLTDDQTDAKWSFPNVSLASGGYMLVYASGKDASEPDQPLHASFKLNASKGGVYLLTSSGQLLDKIEYENQIENISLGRDASDRSKEKTFDKPTPGFSNDDAGYAAFQESRKMTDSPLMITEVMSSNKTTLSDNTGVYNDYIEIYNSGSEAVSLQGYGLSDDPADVLEWKFPDVSIGPGAYLVVFASGADLASTDLEKGAIHTNFRISSYQETIVLSSPAGLLVDQVAVAELGTDTAWARGMESGAYGDNWSATNQPTPGYANSDEGYAQFQQSNQVALWPEVNNT